MKTADARVAAQSAITGATPEQQLAGREANRRTFADMVANVASNVSNLRDQERRNYQGQKNRYYAQRLGIQDELAGIEKNEANQWASAANNAFSGAAYMAGAGLTGAGSSDPLGDLFKKWGAKGKTPKVG